MSRKSIDPATSALGKLVSSCLLLESTQQPNEFIDAVMDNGLQEAGVTVIKKKDPTGVTIYFDSLPKEDRIELSFLTYSHSSWMEATLDVYWGEYSYQDSTYSFRLRFTLDGMKRLIHEFPSIVASMEAQAPAFERKRKERESSSAKRKKVKEMKLNAIKSLLSVLCSNLEFPYRINQTDTGFELSIMMPDQTIAVFQLPVSRFEDVISETSALVGQFVDIYANKKIKVLVLKAKNADLRRSWITNKHDG